MPYPVAVQGPRPTWVIFDGQSHNIIPAAPENYSDMLMAQRGLPFAVVAYGGASWTQLQNGTGGPEPLVDRWTPYWSLPGVEHLVAVLNGGTQDILEGDTAAGIYTDISAYADAIRAGALAHGITLVSVISTTIPRVGPGAYPYDLTPTQETTRTDFNALLIADADSRFDNVVDLEPVLTDTADPDQYHADRVHLSVGGAQLAAAAVMPALDAVLAAA